MKDLWRYGEGEWIIDDADAVGELDAVCAHMSWR